MANISSKGFRRNPEAVKKYLKRKADTIVALEDIEIHIPDRYFDTNLGIKGDNITVFNCFPIIVGNNYGITTTMSYVDLSPSELRMNLVDGVGYHILGFSKGDVVSPSTVSIKNDEIVYPIVNEFMVNGNIPWYVGYEDIIKIFKTAKTHANSNIDKSIASVEALISHLARDRDDPDMLYRLTDMKKKIKWIGFRSPEYALSDTTNRLIGAYMKQGINTSLIKTSNSQESIEDLLRR